MKKKLLATTALAATLATSSAFAEGAFDGINAQVGVGFASLGTELSGSYSNLPNQWGDTWGGSSNDKYSQTGVMGTASLGYSYGFKGGFNIAANAFYLGGAENAGQSSGNDASAGTGYSNSSSYNNQAKLKNIWGLVVEPGYYFAKESLGFAKLGWAQASSSVQTNEFNSTNTPANSSQNINFGTSNGFLYGLGFKQMVASNIYVGVEAYQIMFSSKSSTFTSASGGSSVTLNSKPNVTYAGLTLGYKF